MKIYMLDNYAIVYIEAKNIARRLNTLAGSPIPQSGMKLRNLSWIHSRNTVPMRL
ncbi:MAG: hypothetical protein ACYCXQ_03180 [Candidatus Humimicrobiaceae bacterium]